MNYSFYNPFTNLSSPKSPKFELSSSKKQKSNKSDCKFAYFFELPTEISYYIISFLNSNDLCNVAKSSHRLREMVKDDMVWKNLCNNNDWKVPREVLVSSNFDHKKYFAEKTTISRQRSLAWNLSAKCNGVAPSKRFKHTATSFGKYIIYIGGQETDTKRFNEVIYFDTETNTFFKPLLTGDAVPKFSRHTAVLVKGRIFIFGGYDGISTNFDLAIFNPVTYNWTNIEKSHINGQCPPSRTNHAAAAVGNKMYIFGGNNNDKNGRYQVLSDFYSFNTDTFTWTNLTQSTNGSYPPSRSGHCMITIDSKLFLFGGGVWNETDGWVNKYNDIHIFNPENMMWTKPECTGLVQSSTFAIPFSIGRFLFIFGGGSKTKNSVINDLHVLDTTSFTWSSPQFEEDKKPSPRDMGTASVIGANVYLMGGYAGGAVSYFDKLSIDAKPLFETSSWTSLPTTGIPSR